MSSASQTPDSSRARRTRGSSQRAAARGERSRGSSRASLLGRVLIALILLINIDGYSSIISEEEGGTLGWPVCNLGYRCTWIIKNGFVYLDKVTSTSDVTPSEIERRLYSLIRKKIGDNPNWRIPIWLSGEYLLINKGTTFDYKLRKYYILKLFKGKFTSLEELNLQRKLVKEKGR